MATGHATHYARMWDDDETDRYSTWEHDYERNFSTLIVASIFVFAAARLTTYIFERLLLSNFPSISTEWCFTPPTQKQTKLQRTQDQILKTVAALVLLCRWPIGLLVPIHLWQSIAFFSRILVLAELSCAALLGSLVVFIRAAHYAAQVTGWEHPDSPVRHFAPTNSWNGASSFGSNTDTYESSVNLWPPARKLGNVLPRSEGSLDIVGDNAVRCPGPAEFADLNDSYFMGFSPAALGTSTWLTTRNFANSLFSNSTSSTTSSDSADGPTPSRDRPTKKVRIVSDHVKKAEVPELVTGLPRRRSSLRHVQNASDTSTTAGVPDFLTGTPLKRRKRVGFEG